MVSSKKQQWILEMIKGPDIVPVGKEAGHYTSKRAVDIMADGKKFTIRPTDVLDLSDPDQLIVMAGDGNLGIPWESINRILYEDSPAPTTSLLQPRISRVRHKFIPSPLGKRG